MQYNMRQCFFYVLLKHEMKSIRVTDLKLVTAIHFSLCSPADWLLRAMLACCFVSLCRCTFTHSMQTCTQSLFSLSHCLAYFQYNSSKTFWTAGYDCLIIIIFLTGNMFSPVLFKQAYLFDQSLQFEIWTG